MQEKFPRFSRQLAAEAFDEEYWRIEDIIFVAGDAGSTVRFVLSGSYQYKLAERFKKLQGLSNDDIEDKRESEMSFPVPAERERERERERKVRSVRVAHG